MPLNLYDYIIYCTGLQLKDFEATKKKPDESDFFFKVLKPFYSLSLNWLAIPSNVTACADNSWLAADTSSATAEFA